ncbi:hypothetical protein Aph02nite_40760 [Actinoplanes philippinensis]|uniref:DNA/RNA non-specific endonuclease n=1 Tax=Actinoplanes philippinensis TaxID=35752 RepID=A0A1I2GTL5_9ACTN|nr:hypothetical protein [Actinoplanes philippinensis]GIE78126.1 hypothetical protein Aph02nite_40760 [Actinoplanes philippinensis]SFF21284.1 hypothetical protein SAMN05421541_107206 [Actinoplanes philippinensis]
MPEFDVALFSQPQMFTEPFGGVLSSVRASVEGFRASFVQATTRAGTDWKGEAADAHREAAKKRADAMDRLQQALANAGRVVQSGGQEMAAMVNALRQFVNSMMSAGFVVMPGGVVLPGPPHYAEATAAGPAGPAVLAAYQAVAADLSVAIRTQVVALTALDSATASALQAVLAGLATVQNLSPGVPDAAAEGFDPNTALNENRYGPLLEWTTPGRNPGDPPIVETRGTTMETYLDTTDLPETGTRGERRIPGGVNPAGYDPTVHARGHLRADTLGGSHSDPENFVTLFHRYDPGDPHINETPMREIEMRVRRVIEGRQAGVPAQNVRYRVEALGDERLPHSVRITALGDRGYRETAVIPNW